MEADGRQALYEMSIAYQPVKRGVCSNPPAYAPANISYFIEMLHQPRPPLPHSHSPLLLVHFAALSLSMKSGYQEEHKLANQHKNNFNSEIHAA